MATAQTPAIAGGGAPGVAFGGAPAVDAASSGRCELLQGQVRLAVAPLEQAWATAAPGLERARAAAALGQAHLRLQHLDRAEALLNEALAGLAAPRERAAVALDLGHLQRARRAAGPADAAYRLALEQAPDDAEVALAVELNRLRLGAAAADERLARLAAAVERVPMLSRAALQARHALDIGAQARGSGAPGQALAQRAYGQAYEAALRAGREAAATDTTHGVANSRSAAARAREAAALAAEAQDGLAALAEAQGRPGEALQRTEQGLRHAQASDERELLVALEWRVARLARAAGDEDTALAAYRRAVQHLEAVRIDMPVQYVDGRSSFRETLAPLYLGLTDLLLRRAARVVPAEQAALLRQARETVELIKQTELEDYLRDRCSVGSARTDQREPPPAGTAVFYPVILPDRLELLVETAQGLSRHTVPVTAEQLQRTALDFVAALRGRGEHRPAGDALYRWLVAPIEPLIAQQQIGTLVVVPDGVLRLVPLAALHDGRDYLVRRLALPTVPGLSLLATRNGAQETPRTTDTTAARPPLLAAMSQPGPVLERLPARLVEAVLPGPPAPARSAADRQALREALALPGARDEVQAIARITHGTLMLDQQFTRAAFEQGLRSGAHAVVHIASHGVFGDSADTTFIMAFDELITLDDLQALLGDARLRRAPIELITLSACQTAEGDDRAPLGMSGTAIKAHARSALGTLWPVSDRAASQLMTGFYRRLAEQRPGKAQALRAAQIELLDTAGLRHPFYWAPFLLLGDWR